MTYPIWIGANKDGKLIIGSKNMTRHEIVSIDHVFGSQLPHRLVAKTPTGYEIMTPTDAIKKGYPVSDFGEVPAYRRYGRFSTVGVA